MVIEELLAGTILEINTVKWTIRKYGPQYSMHLNICGFNMVVLHNITVLKCVIAVKELSWTLDYSWM
jgi:hypothetical protein